MSSLPWIDVAESCIGIKEIPGSANNREILRWAEEMKQRYYTEDSIPWCGLFAGHCLFEAKVDLKPVGNILWALSYRKLGFRVDPCYGAVMVFGRTGGGHVAFYISEDEDYFHVLGGNQSDKVCISRHNKENLVEARWPSEYRELHVPGRILNPNFTPG